MTTRVIQKRNYFILSVKGIHCRDVLYVISILELFNITVPVALRIGCVGAGGESGRPMKRLLLWTRKYTMKSWTRVAILNMRENEGFWSILLEWHCYCLLIKYGMRKKTGIKKINNFDLSNTEEYCDINLDGKDWEIHWGMKYQ